MLYPQGTLSSPLYLVSMPSFILWTIALQADLSMGFPRQEYWGGLPFPSPGDLPYPGIELASPALQVNSLPLSHLESLGASLSPRFYFCTWQLPVFTLECKQHREDHTLKKLVTIVKRLVFRSSIFSPCHVNIYGMIILCIHSLLPFYLNSFGFNSMRHFSLN